MRRTFRHILSIFVTVTFLVTCLPTLAQLCPSGTFASNVQAHAASLSVKSFWASRHMVGKITFKWTKQPSASVNGWSIKYRTRKIGGNNTWSGWTYKSFGASTMEATVAVKRDYVIEIHAQGQGDTTWSAGVITTPAGGKYQAMKTVYVKNASTKQRVDSIKMDVGQTVMLRPDYEYSVKNYTQRPRLYPNHMLYDIADKSLIAITNSKGKAYNGGLIDGIAIVKGLRPGTTTLICRAPNGRAKTLRVTVGGKDVLSIPTTPLSYADQSVPQSIPDATVYHVFHSDATSAPVCAREDDPETIEDFAQVLATDEPKKFIFDSDIQFAARYEVGSNTEIDATGVTVFAGSNGDGCLSNKVTSGNYDSASNIIIRGGTWKRSSGYHKKTMMLFAHCNNMRLEDITEECDFTGGHCIELVACKDVVVKNCDLRMKGTNSPDNEDEPLQIDHANKVTSPTVSLKNNNPCQNIQVVGCTLIGGRGLCSGHCGNDASAQSIYHRNIVVQDNYIEGKSAEALALYNVVGCEVIGNTIKSSSSNVSHFHSDGMCVRIPKGSTAPSDMARSSLTIKNNTVYGGRCGIIVNSLSKSDFGVVIVTNNTVYYKGTDKNAVVVSRWYNDTTFDGCVAKLVADNTLVKGWK